MRSTAGERALSGFAAAALAEPPGDGRAALEDDLATMVRRLPAPARMAARAGGAALDIAALVALGHRLGELPPGRGGALLARLAGVAPLSPGLEGLKMLAMFAGGARVAGAEAPSPQCSPHRPDAVLDVTAAVDWPPDARADAVVVGSGAGGAMAARTLAQAGREVVVVEEGRRFGGDEFRERSAIERFTALYRGGGATAALGRPPVVVPLGRGVGGTTLVNSGTCFRPPASVVDRWHEAGFAPAAPGVLEPYVEEVWRTLEVARAQDAVLGRNAHVALAGAAALGWSAAPLERNAPGCGGCCQCALGCPRNAKAGVHLNALPEACAAGARIVADARVERITCERGRATGVIARRRDGSVLRVHAPLVLVAAGAVETPPLLRRSGIGGHPQLGRNLALHPGVSVAGRMPEPVVSWRGVLQSVGVDAFHAGEGILIEATATPPGLGSLALPGWGSQLRAELADSDRLATLGAMVADLPSGRVVGRRRPLMLYRLARRDGARLLRAIELSGRLLLAAGASEVLTGLAHQPRVHDVRSLLEATAGADPRRLHVAAFHPSGTARAGADPVRCPVDPDGRLRGVDGVWVSDASVLPSCPEVNPQVSIMACALAIADAAVAA